MTEWDFDQRLKELETKALFRKMNIDAFKQMGPSLLFIIGSITFLIESVTVGQIIASLCFVFGSILMMLASAMR